MPALIKRDPAGGENPARFAAGITALKDSGPATAWLSAAMGDAQAAGWTHAAAVTMALRAENRAAFDVLMKEGSDMLYLASIADPDYDLSDVVDGFVEHGFGIAALRTELIRARAEADEHTDSTRPVAATGDVYKARAAQIDALAEKAGHARKR